MNAYNIPYWGWVIFIIGSIGCVAAALIAGFSKAWREREKKDGLR